MDRRTEQIVEHMQRVAAADLRFEDFMAEAVRIIPTVGLAHEVAGALPGVGGRRLELAISAGVFLPEEALL